MEQLFKDTNAEYYRSLWKSYYYNKYLNLWLNRFKINGLTKAQRVWLLKTMWFENQPICAFKGLDLDKSYLGMLPEKEQAELGGNVGLCFSTFATSQYNMYACDATGYIINNLGVPYIPGGVQKVGKDVVVLYPTYPGKSLKYYALPILNTLVDLRMMARKGTLLATGGAGIEVNGDCPQRADTLAQKMLSDEAIAFIESGETKSINPFNLSFQWNADKIRMELEANEAELRCLLGIQSVATEKKERLISDEANSLSEMCELSKDCLLNPLKEFFAEIKEVLGFTVAIEDPYERKEETEDVRETGSDKDNVQ